jgi:hypothetical protein
LSSGRLARGLANPRSRDSDDQQECEKNDYSGASIVTLRSCSSRGLRNPAKRSKSVALTDPEAMVHLRGPIANYGSLRRLVARPGHTWSVGQEVRTGILVDNRPQSIKDEIPGLGTAKSVYMPEGPIVGARDTSSAFKLRSARLASDESFHAGFLRMRIAPNLQ